MRCSGKHDTTVHELFRVVSRFPRYISCYIVENQFPLEECGTELAYLFRMSSIRQIVAATAFLAMNIPIM